VGIAWQQLQPSLYGSFDSSYLQMMDEFVSNCQSSGMYVGFVPLPSIFDCPYILNFLIEDFMISRKNDSNFFLQSS
jgi:hypothetical protein